ncbi:MAG: flocculation-associated PEP-CTERM protein PepA [Burkholderiaceae bacterium]|nr:flocculation-associated PEP-CTERM protein PepA [Burkholderiaceae bacterium]
MSTLRKKLQAAAVGFALLGSASAFATTITNSAGTFANWGGFDWAADGLAVVQGYDASNAVGDSFQLTYYATAAQLRNSTGGIAGFGLANVGIILGNFEYTIRVILNETSTCTAFAGFCTSASFATTSGSFEVFYDTSVDAVRTTGAGYTDGTLLIEGTIPAQASGGFNVITGGSATIQGDVTFTSPLINPSLLGTTATSTLQLGGTVTSFVPPTSMVGDAGGTSPLAVGDLVFQADANQDFTARPVPEPGTLALAGLAMLGIGFARARRSNV